MQIPFERSFASHEKAAYWSDKNKVKPNDVFMCSGKTFIFNCGECNHEFNRKLNDINRGRWCPYCSNTLLCSNDECNQCFNKSFASSDKAQNLLDKSLNPRNIFKYSNKIYKFICAKCKHVLSLPLNALEVNWCKYCANQDLCDSLDCQTCFNKSFASSELINIWSNKNTENPRNLLKYTHKKYLFDCKVCNHVYSCSLANLHNNRGCPYCINKKLCSDMECIICFNKSFASHEKACFWSEKNKLKPRDVFKQSYKKYIFKCDVCKMDFSSTLGNIYYNKWCSKCKRKTETKTYDFLKYKYSIISQPRYDWCKNPETNRHLPFDLECNNRIIIEIDGAQHFRQVWNWKSPEEQNAKDNYKMECAIKNNMHIIRIYQEDIYNNRNKWDIKLLETITNLLTIETPTIRYIGDVYNTYNKLDIAH
jgi:hypothetical protein